MKNSCKGLVCIMCLELAFLAPHRARDIIFTSLQSEAGY